MKFMQNTLLFRINVNTLIPLATFFPCYVQIVLFDLYSKRAQTIKEKNSNGNAILDIY